MELKNLLESGANISLTVSLNDLKQLFKELAGTVEAVTADCPADDY